MIRMMVGDGADGAGRAERHGGRRWRPGLVGAWVRRMWGWLTNSGYRPERRYMRGGMTHR